MDPLLDPSLDPLFWPNLRAGAPSAWHGHVPFAHWLVTRIRPRVIVELGTHAGVSYTAFCQAVARHGLDTRCTAIDTWAGDDHAGAYSEDVLAELTAFNDTNFAAFSHLRRTTFDDAVGHFTDASIDLLHIDGFHSYEAVRHDFETWRPKLSDRAVVLFHDTDVRVRDFGVWRFWEEIRNDHAGSLEFIHGFGLGVLLVGAHPPEPLPQLCAGPVEIVRARFAALGERMILASESNQPRTTPIELPPALAPFVDPTLDAGVIHIAERFAGPPGMRALQLPADAVRRGDGGCTIWVVSRDGRHLRRGEPPSTSGVATVPLAFTPFTNTEAEHFHLFVTDACAPGPGLPQALADLLPRRRTPIAVDTPGAIPQSAFNLDDGVG